MEDQKGDMEQNSKKYPRIRRIFSQANDLTLMIVGKKGNVRTFKISFRFLFWTSALLALYLFASIFVFYAYLDERRTNSGHLTELKRLQHEINETKRTLDRSKHRLTLLKNSIKDLESRDKASPELASPTEKPDIISVPTEVEREPVEKVERELVEKAESIPAEQFVDIKDLSIKKEGNELTISFNIVNVKNKGPADGYVHIVAIDKHSDPPQFLAYPKVALKDGIPINFKRGQPFLIRRFKTISGRYLLDTETESVSSMKVLIYNKSGTLVLQKEFEVKNAS